MIADVAKKKSNQTKNIFLRKKRRHTFGNVLTVDMNQIRFSLKIALFAKIRKNNKSFFMKKQIVKHHLIQ